MAIKVLEEKCAKNHKCPASAACPAGALTQKDEQSSPVVDIAKCIECGLCTSICPNGALVREE